ncbi:NmrA domain-containing protein [Favolaschia claudopus]|uniref:NmrA domain-containing protein n=1 Tax=Favolaschia claudopus TaxID=2862362 RepID=A0AAW0B896_9AGAR
MTVSQSNYSLRYLALTIHDKTHISDAFPDAFRISQVYPYWRQVAHGIPRLLWSRQLRVTIHSRGSAEADGGSVVDALLKDGTFVPRAITRDPDSDASKKLKARGVEVVKGDSGDKTGLVRALKGSEGVFAVTLPPFFQASGHGPSELVQGTNIVDAAKEAGVRFFIWSIFKLSGGKYTNAVHYDEKAAVQEYLAASGLIHASLHLPGFLESIYQNQLLKKADSGFTMSWPVFKEADIEAWVWVSRDVPAAVLALLKNYPDPSKQINGKTYPVVTGTVSCAKLMELASNALECGEIPATTIPSTGVVAMDEMLKAHAEHKGLFQDTPVPNSDLVALGMKFSTLEQFMETELKPRYT